MIILYIYLSGVPVQLWFEIRAYVRGEYEYKEALFWIAALWPLVWALYIVIVIGRHTLYKPWKWVEKRLDDARYEYKSNQTKGK